MMMHVDIVVIAIIFPKLFIFGLLSISKTFGGNHVGTQY